MATANLSNTLASLRSATDWMTSCLANKPNMAAAGCSPYLRMWGLTLGGHLLAKGALKARTLLNEGSEDAAFLEHRITVARFFAEQIILQATTMLPAIISGSELLYAIPEDQLVS